MAQDLTKMQDIKYSEKTLWQQYYNYIQDQDVIGALTFLNANPSLKYKVFNAFNWNRLINAVNDGTSNTQPTTESMVGQWNYDYGRLQTASANFKYVGQWTNGTQYHVNNLVKFNDTTAYFCIQDHTANTTNQPPNSTYWILALQSLPSLGIQVSSTQPTNINIGDIWFSYRSFNNDSWETINSFIEDGTISSVYSIGDEKTVTLGTGATITLVILDYYHDDLSDGSGKAAVTLGMRDLLNDYKMYETGQTNAVSWQNSSMRTYMNTLITQLPSDLQPLIKTVNKKTSAGNMSSDIITTQDKLFLPSYVEIKPTPTNIYVDEGTTYKYWNDLFNEHPSSDSIYIKKYNNGQGSANRYWLRSPATNSDSDFIAVMAAGNFGQGGGNSNSGISYMLCL